MATLKNALEMKAISDAIDLTPILDNIGDAALASAADGDYQTTVSIKDSVYAKRITQIASQLMALGYEVTVKDFEITLSWVNAK